MAGRAVAIQAIVMTRNATAETVTAAGFTNPSSLTSTPLHSNPRTLPPKNGICNGFATDLQRYHDGLTFCPPAPLPWGGLGRSYIPLLPSTLNFEKNKGESQLFFIFLRYAAKFQLFQLFQ